MRSSLFLLFSLFFCFPVFAAEENGEEEQELRKELFGWIEKVRIYPPGDLEIHAKLDTGADHCSLSAQNIEVFERDGKEWVRFEVTDRRGRSKVLELESHRTARIKRVSGRPDERYVVRMGVCLGDRFMEVDVNLANRTNFSYPMLVGRSFLSAHGIVDPAKTYTTEPDCSFPDADE